MYFKDVSKLAVIKVISVVLLKILINLVFIKKFQSTTNIGIFEKIIDCIVTLMVNLISESRLGFYKRSFFQQIKTCFKTKKIVLLAKL